MASQPPVDQAGFAELIQRFGAYLDAQNAARNVVPVAERNGPGPWNFTDDNEGGKRLRVGNGNNAATIIVNLSKSADVGTVFMPRQVGLGAVKFVPENGASLVPFQPGHNGTGGVNAVVLLTCESNPDGNSAVWHLDGVTGAVA